MNHNHILGRDIPESFYNPFQNVLNELLGRPVLLAGNTDAYNDTDNIDNSAE